MEKFKAVKQYIATWWGALEPQRRRDITVGAIALVVGFVVGAVLL